MTLDAILARVAAHLSLAAEDLLDDATLREQFIGYVNTAQAHLVGVGDWPWLTTSADQSTVVNQDYLSMPADFLGLPVNRWPRLTDTGEPLQIVPVEALEAYRLRSPSGSRPLAAALEYHAAAAVWRMYLWPTPSEVLTLRIPYRRQIFAMSDVAAVPAIPLVLHETLVLGAMAEAEEQYHRVPVGSQRAKYESQVVRDWARYGSASRDQIEVRLRPFDDNPCDKMGEEPIVSVRVEV